MDRPQIIDLSSGVIVGSTGRILVEQQEQQESKRRWSRLGLIIRILLLGSASVLCYHFLLSPLFISGFGNADTRPVPGDASRFDPIAALPDVKAYAGEGAQLISIEADYIRSDGTMELTADYTPAPNVEYKFAREVPRPADAPPVGAGGANRGSWYEPISVKAYQPGKWWSVSRSGGGVTTSYSYMNQGMEREADSPENGLSDQFVADPTCSFVDLWQTAMKHDAPKEAVAVIEYNQDGYSFSISGLSVYLTFDTKCQLTEYNGMPAPTLAVPEVPPTSP